MIRLKLCLLVCVLAFSQDSRLFKQALTNYQSQDYANAERIFESLTRSREKDPAFVMLLFSLYAQQQYTQVTSTYKAFLQSKPKSEWLDDAYYIVGKAYFQLEDFPKALNLWLQAYEHSEKKSVRLKSGEVALQTIDALESDDILKELQQNHSGEKVQELLSFKLADIEENQNKYANARFILSQFVKNYPNSKYTKQANESIARLNEKLANEIHIGVLLPFDSHYADEVDYAEEMLTGIEFAVKIHNEQHKQQIHLIKESTGNTILEAVLAAQRIAENQSIIALVGPHDNNLVAAISETAKKHALPLITANAMQTKLSDLSPYTFQLASDYYILGKSIAEYSFGVQKHRSFGVINNAFGKSAEIAQGFIQTIENLGGEIVGQEIYYPEFKELNSQFEQIHKAGIKKMFRDSLEAAEADSALLVLDSLYVLRTQRAFEEAESFGKVVDSSRIEVNSIDAIFLPISGYDSENVVSFVAKSIRRNRFKTQLLGSDEWYVPKLIESNLIVSRSIDSMFVFTPMFPDPYNSKYQEFKTGFTQMTGTRPTQSNITGFRTAEFIFLGLQETSNSRENLFETLRKTETFNLVGGTIHFDYKERVNSGINVLRVTNNSYQKLR